MIEVFFYNSAICPRCQISKLALASVLKEFPEITIKPVEYLKNIKSARDAEVKTIPALLCGDRKLSGIIFTRKRLRHFFSSLSFGDGGKL